MGSRRSSQDIGAFGQILYPEEAMEPILAAPVRGALLEWLTEIWSSDDLEAVGLKPRKRALFGGPPGVGKTTLAHHLAARLGLPMLAVGSERLIDSYVGSSARNIGALFDTAAEQSEENPIILFLDEFDALAVTRRRAEQGADDARNQWVNVLLQRVENYTGFVIAATNRSYDIDPAVWRRFELQVMLDLPGPFERARIIERYLHPYTVPEGPLEILAAAFEGAAPALIRQFCEAMKRYCVIGPRVGWSMVKEQAVTRITSTIQPHPDLEKPPLWLSDSREGRDAIEAFPWPLEIAKDRAA